MGRREEEGLRSRWRKCWGWRTKGRSRRGRGLAGVLGPPWSSASCSFYCFKASRSTCKVTAPCQALSLGFGA